MVTKKRKKVLPKKKAVKKSSKRKLAKKPVILKTKKEKSIGEVTHFFGKIKVAIVKFKVPVKTGMEVWFKGATTDFKQAIQSMQFDHKPVSLAKKGKEVGVKVKKQVREGDGIFPAPRKSE